MNSFPAVVRHQDTFTCLNTGGPVTGDHVWLDDNQHSGL